MINQSISWERSKRCERCLCWYRVRTGCHSCSQGQLFAVSWPLNAQGWLETGNGEFPRDRKSKVGMLVTLVTSNSRWWFGHDLHHLQIDESWKVTGVEDIFGHSRIFQDIQRDPTWSPDVWGRLPFERVTKPYRYIYCRYVCTYNSLNIHIFICVYIDLSF